SNRSRRSPMSNQVVLITGALAGIGRATALAFAREGASLVVSGRRDDEGQRLVTELRALGAEAEFVNADVRHESDVQNLVDKTVAAVWPPRRRRQQCRHRRQARPGHRTERGEF